MLLTSLWRHRQVRGAVLTSSTESTSRYCPSSRSRFCPYCRLLPTVCSDSSLKAVKSSWSGPAASSLQWILDMPEERSCRIISSLCFGLSLWWFRTLLWSLRSSCLVKDSTTQRFLCLFYLLFFIHISFTQYFRFVPVLLHYLVKSWFVILFLFFTAKKLHIHF